MKKCLSCPSGFSNIYSISSGSKYNPYHCYHLKYTLSADVSANSGTQNWNAAYDYCVSKTSGSTLVRIEDNIYDRPSANFLI